MATPTSDYTATELAAMIRASDEAGVEEENITFIMRSLTGPSSHAAALAAIQAVSDTLAALHPGWNIFKTLQYTGTTAIYTVNEDIPAA
ncbi:hypothetical protein [Streptomyces sp. BE133]|uniref:hypothetical protein n=1 Tax=Streptomyces sp. BE133 TaxID=3002523 RepID=UPI002E784375|nr:hypothetical protein [Streptomyces sp. BE133]MEE1812704.1 hypothetical protein [Streptomyces sp. BE133]